MPHEIIEHPMFTDPLLRYYFNAGVYNFGRFVEHELDKAEKRASKSAGRRNKRPNERVVQQARMMTLTRCLGMGQQAKQYRDPGKVTATEFSA